MALDTTAIIAAIESHAAASGWFEKVNGHEPKSAPATVGLSCAVWLDSIGPVRTSGLTITSGLMVFNIRLYTSMLSDPPDAIDPNMAAAVDALFTAYSGDFELGGLVRDVDLFGANGTPMSARAGYLNQDGKLYRVMTITLPCVVNDLWTQAP